MFWFFVVCFCLQKQTASGVFTFWYENLMTFKKNELCFRNHDCQFPFLTEFTITNFCIVASNISVSSKWKLLHATFLSSSILRRLQKKDFGKFLLPYLFVNIFICFRVFSNLIPLNLGQGLRPLFRNLFTINSFNRNYFSDINTLRTGSFKLFRRPFPGFFLTILTL